MANKYLKKILITTSSLTILMGGGSYESFAAPSRLWSFATAFLSVLPSTYAETSVTNSLVSVNVTNYQSLFLDQSCESSAQSYESSYPAFVVDISSQGNLGNNYDLIFTLNDNLVDNNTSYDPQYYPDGSSNISLNDKMLMSGEGVLGFYNQQGGNGAPYELPSDSSTYLNVSQDDGESANSNATSHYQSIDAAAGSVTPASVVNASSSNQQGGNQIQQDGNQIQQDGNQIQQDGNQIQQGGNQIQQDGNQIQQDGNQIQQDGNQIQQGGNQIQQDVNQTQQGGNQIQQDGNQIQQDGNQIQQVGNQIQQGGNQNQQDANQNQQDVNQNQHGVSNLIHLVGANQNQQVGVNNSEAIAPSTPKPVFSSAKIHGAIAATSGISSDVATTLSSRAASPVSITEIAASGDEATNRKLWAKAFGSKGTQKGTNAAKSNSFGMTIGGDIDLLNDTMLLGAAFTHAKLNVKVKDEATVRANVNMASIYARHDILKRAFVTSSVSYGLVDVKNLTFSGSKNKAHAFKANVNLGYKITLKNGALVTPKIGLSYDNVQIKSLKLTAAAKGIKANMDRVSTDLSLSVAKNFKVSDALNLRPSAHIGLNHIHHQNKLLDKTDALVTNPNAPKTSYNAGVSVVASGNKAVSLDLGYNFNWKAKYRAHSGFAKLEIKF
jgi:outer membrane autotransporter protein